MGLTTREKINNDAEKIHNLILGKLEGDLTLEAELLRDTGCSSIYCGEYRGCDILVLLGHTQKGISANLQAVCNGGALKGSFSIQHSTSKNVVLKAIVDLKKKLMPLVRNLCSICNILSGDFQINRCKFKFSEGEVKGKVKFEENGKEYVLPTIFDTLEYIHYRNEMQYGCILDSLLIESELLNNTPSKQLSITSLIDHSIFENLDICVEKNSIVFQWDEKNEDGGIDKECFSISVFAFLIKEYLKEDFIDFKLKNKPSLSILRKIGHIIDCIAKNYKEFYMFVWAGSFKSAYSAERLSILNHILINAHKAYSNNEDETTINLHTNDKYSTRVEVSRNDRGMSNPLFLKYVMKTPSYDIIMHEELIDTNIEFNIIKLLNFGNM